jgi:hypothetical protein
MTQSDSKVLVVLFPFTRFKSEIGEKGIRAKYKKSQITRINPSDPLKMAVQIEGIFDNFHILDLEKINLFALEDTLASSQDSKLIRAYRDPTCYTSKISQDFHDVLNRHDFLDVFIINGRGRVLKHDLKTKMQLSLRRRINEFLVVELAFSILFFILTPIFLLFDLARGKR